MDYRAALARQATYGRNDVERRTCRLSGEANLGPGRTMRRMYAELGRVGTAHLGPRRGEPGASDEGDRLPKLS